MSAIVIVGAQWGDEGKGKIVDLYARYADAVVRYGGGANAGHTLVVGSETLVLHLVPSGVLHGDLTCVLAPGMVIDPVLLLSELDALEKRGIPARKRVLVAERAHVVLAHHRAIDALREDREGGIGTTRRGIGPAYEDKVARRGIRVGDLLRPERLRELVRANIEGWKPFFQASGAAPPSVDETMDSLLGAAASLRPLVLDSDTWVASAIEQRKNILLEGAQGTLLDVDHGTYPFVTSSSVIAGGACAGAGLGPTAISRVIGIAKAYATRVGSGPFPTELEPEAAARLRAAGREFGATTGRPRRCGWIDLPALRHAVRVNGLSELAITKLDVLCGTDPVAICTAYELDGERIDAVPFEGLERVVPIYEWLAGWSEPLEGCSTLEDLPPNARAFLARIEELSGCKIGLVSIGAERDSALGLSDPFQG